MLHVLSGKLQRVSERTVSGFAVSGFAVSEFAVSDIAVSDFAVSDFALANCASRQRQIPAANACESLRYVFTLQDAISNKEKTPRNAQYITFPVFSK